MRTGTTVDMVVDHHGKTPIRLDDIEALYREFSRMAAIADDEAIADDDEQGNKTVDHPDRQSDDINPEPSDLFC